MYTKKRNNQIIKFLIILITKYVSDFINARCDWNIHLKIIFNFYL